MRKLIFIDIDETLIFSKARIYVREVNTNKIIRKLSNMEFNNYQLKENEYFTFEEFSNSELFIKTSIPNIKIIELAKKLYEEGNEVCLLTARADFDNKTNILNFFKDFGIKVGHYKNGEIHIIRSGNYKFIDNVARRKSYIIDKILRKRKNEFKIIEMFDDSISNLKEFLRLSKKYKSKIFNAYLVEKEKIIKI